MDVGTLKRIHHKLAFFCCLSIIFPVGTYRDTGVAEEKNANTDYNGL
jgi:hypothetical protein